MAAVSVQAVTDCFLHTLRNVQLGDVAALPMAALSSHGTLFDQRFQNLFNEKRIALSLVMDRISEIIAHALTEQRAELRSGFGFIEATQDDASD